MSAWELLGKAARVAAIADQIGIDVYDIRVNSYTVGLQVAGDVDDVDRLGDALGLPAPGRVYGEPGRQNYERGGALPGMERVDVFCGAPPAAAAVRALDVEVPS